MTTTDEVIDQIEQGIESYRRTKRKRLNHNAPATTDPTPSVTEKTILPDDDELATTLYEIDSGHPGPTGFVLGGQHGDETSGWKAAENLTEMTPTSGTLVVVPRANEPAIEQGTRGVGYDLNRTWNIGGPPTRDLSRAIWSQFEAYDPDVCLDLHNSKGIFKEPNARDGKGQVIFPTPYGRSVAETVAEELNEEYVYPAGKEKKHRFRVGNDQDGSFKDGKFSHKVGYQTDTVGYLFEVTRWRVSPSRRVEWETAGAVKLLEKNGLVLE